MFVEKVDRGGKVQPRFAYMGEDEETVRAELAQNKAPAQTKRAKIESVACDPFAPQYVNNVEKIECNGPC